MYLAQYFNYNLNDLIVFFYQQIIDIFNLYTTPTYQFFATFKLSKLSMNHLTQQPFILRRKIETAEINLQCDFPDQYTKKDFQIAIKAIKRIYQQRPNEIDDKFLQSFLKENKFQPIQQRMILYIIKQRSRNYLSDNKNENHNQKQQFCVKPKYKQFYQKITKNISYLEPQKNSSQRKIPKIDLTQAVKINQYQHSVKFDQDQQGQLLVQINSQLFSTGWLVKQDSNRYIWKSKILLDQKSVIKLLKFILTKRNNKDNYFPRIIINTGSHGDQHGKNAYQAQDQKLVDHTITMQVILALFSLSELQSIKLDKSYIEKNIYVNLMNINNPCSYHQFAEHIIDTTCNSAFQVIHSKQLITSLHDKNKGKSVLMTKLQLINQSEPQNKNGWLTMNSQMRKAIEQYLRIPLKNSNYKNNPYTQ